MLVEEKTREQITQPTSHTKADTYEKASKAFKAGKKPIEKHRAEPILKNKNSNKRENATLLKHLCFMEISFKSKFVQFDPQTWELYFFSVNPMALCQLIPKLERLPRTMDANIRNPTCVAFLLLMFSETYGQFHGVSNDQTQNPSSLSMIFGVVCAPQTMLKFEQHLTCGCRDKTHATYC
jgi:hypothetical protein